MDFKLVQKANKKTSTSVSGAEKAGNIFSFGDNVAVVGKDLIRQVVDLLDNTECTCVWSDFDNQYIKVNDVNRGLVKKLKSLL